MSETSFHKSTYSLNILFVYLHVMWPQTNTEEPWTCKCVVKPLKYHLKISRVLADKKSFGTSAPNSSDMIHVRSSHKHDHSDATQRQHFLNYNILGQN